MIGKENKSIEIGKERKEYCYVYDVSLDKKTEKKLVEYARKTIVNDVPHLIEYAIKKGLQNKINALLGKGDMLEKFVSKKRKK